MAEHMGHFRSLLFKEFKLILFLFLLGNYFIICVNIVNIKISSQIPTNSRPFFFYIYKKIMLTDSGSFSIPSVTLLSVLAGFLITAGITTYSNDRKSKEIQNYSKSLESQMSSLPLVQTLRADPNFEESRGYENFDKRTHNLTASTLKGKGRIAVNPFVFYSKERMELILITHVGEDLCGHVGFVHGKF